VTLEEGLFKAVHSSRKLLMVLEGTGKGNVGWFADKWRATKEDWPQGRSRFCPVFLNWPLSPDIYPQADWLRKFPVPDGWEPKPATRNHVRKCELYIREHRLPLADRRQGLEDAPPSAVVLGVQLR
jgi:hypothetical protein